MVAPAVFENGIKRIIDEFGQVFTYTEPGQAPRQIEGVITTVQNGNAQLVNSVDIESEVFYCRANVAAPRKFGTIVSNAGKRFVIQETHAMEVKGVTVCYKSILKA